MKLEELAESIAVDIAFWMEAIVDPDSPVDELGQTCLSVSEKLRALAIVQLVTKSNQESFYFNLVRSGRAWRTYLARVIKENATEDHHYCTGRFQPIIDTIASGNLELAREIARLSPSHWRKGHEYEDDFCYGRLLQLMVQESSEGLDFSEIVAQFERYVDGNENARLKIVRALISDDQDEFDEAFQDLLDAHDVEILEKKEGGQLEEPITVAQRRIFMEGLAILRTAEARGFETALEYDFCPSLARVRLDESLPEDSAPDITGWLS